MARYEIADELRKGILKDLESGEMTWTEIAKKHKVEFKIIQSVYWTKKVRKQSEETQKGGVERYWAGMRLTDGEPSPVTTYNIKDLVK